MNRPILYGATLALAFAARASARMPGVHGGSPYAIMPANQTITFGAETLAGYGGYHLPPAVTLSNLLDASGNASNDFGYDASGDIVPRGSYGAAPPVYNGPYTGILSDGLSAGSVTIALVPNMSTVKSHFGFALNADTATSFQLATVLGSSSNIHLGDTVIIRGGTGEVGPTPALNPINGNVGASGRYTIVPPETSGGVTYTGSGRIRIQCETPNVATDGNGNPVQGGNCDVGGFLVNSTYDVQVPFDFFNIHFYDNHVSIAPAATPFNFMLAYKSLGLGVSVYSSRFECGPAITSAYDRLYTIGALQMRLGTAANNHFVGCENAIAGGPNPSSPWYITGNVFEGMVEDAIDYGTNGGGADATNNFFFNFAGGTPNASPGDGFKIGAKIYTFVAPGSAMIDGQVPVSPNPDQTVANAVCTIMVGGAGCLAGINYPAAETTDSNVANAVRSVNGPTYVVTITAAAPALSLGVFNSTYGTTTSASSSAWSTAAIASVGGTASLTFSPNHADTFQFVQGNVSGLARAGLNDRNISIRGVENPNGGSRQFYFMNPVYYCCFIGGEVKNNIASLTAGNSITPERFNNPNISNNTSLADVGSTTYAPNDPSYDTLVGGGSGLGWYSSINRSVNNSVLDGGGGGTFVNNLANVFSTGVQTTLGSIPSYSFMANTSGTTMTVTGGTVPVAATPLVGPGLPTFEWVASVSGNIITLGANVTTPQSGATFNTVDPFFGQPAGSFTLAGNESVNWSGSSPNLPLDGTKVAAIYRSFLPNYPAIGGVLATNRAQVIRIFTPSVGAIFAGSISSVTSPYRLTVTGGVAPTVNSVINGPNIPNGDSVVAVSGSTLTLLFAPTGTGSGLVFGTGAMNPDGTYNGALFPNGCWNDNSVYNPATACTAAQ